jgi:argininosuccinate lyase
MDSDKKDKNKSGIKINKNDKNGKNDKSETTIDKNDKSDKNDSMRNSRFEKNAAEITKAFNASLNVDCRLFRQDIAGSIAHATMLGERGIITPDESAVIIACLKTILSDGENGGIKFDCGEDIHSFVEAELILRLKDKGAAGKKLHTGRSRNDQVATDMRLYVKDGIDYIAASLKDFIGILTRLAARNLNTYMPAFTHMQKAQPSTLAHYLTAYAEMFLRDIERLLDCKTRTDVLPLGSGAVCGTTYPLDRPRVAQLLGFSKISQNSIDAVSDRDFCLEYLFCLSVIMMHFSRLCEELIIWSNDEFKYVEFDDGFATGSSMMPQKKNPDMAELTRGRTGRVYGDLIAMLTVMKGLPLAYNKDMQEDKSLVFDGEDTVLSVIDLFNLMFPTMKFNNARLNDAALGGYTNATDVADYMVKAGVPFKEAHDTVGSMVRYCIKNGKRLEELSLDEYNTFSPLFKKDILDAIKINNLVDNRTGVGAPSPHSVEREIKHINAELSRLFAAKK